MVRKSRSSRDAVASKSSSGPEQVPKRRLQAPGGRGCATATAVTVDRRNTAERRDGTWRAFVYGNFRPRRRSSRREADAHHFWFDWHEPRVLYLALGILLLSCTDALFTLNLMHAGAIEANPLMASMLAMGLDDFILGKIGITSCSVVVLVVVARRSFFGTFSVEHLLRTILAGYILLVCYEIYMFWYVFDLSILPSWLDPG